MSFAAALILAASAAPQAVPDAPPRVRASATASVSVTILPATIVRLGEDANAPAPADAGQVPILRQRRADGRRVLVEFH